MPCQYCKLPGHTLRQCNADISIHIDQIVRTIDSIPFALRNQFTALDMLQKPILSLMCVRLGLSNSSKRKAIIISDIIHYYFMPRILRASGGDMNTKLLISEAFRNLQMWNIDYIPDIRLFREQALNMLDRYYTAAFGISYTTSLQAVQRIPESIRLITLLTFPREALVNLIMQQNYHQHPAFVQLLQRQQQQQQPNAHLKKLDFHIKTDNSLEEAKECFICSEERPHAKLGCAHEYCIDCLFGTAKVRTKSFITCAVCRAEIEEVQVGTSETKTGLLQRLSEV